MSDNEDLLGDDLGDQSLADYNLGNEEEEQLLADDYESGPSQNVPASVVPGYGSASVMVSPEYPVHAMAYNAQVIPYQPAVEPECVVPNITVEVPNQPLPDHSTYAPYEPPVYEPVLEHAVVPPAIPAAPLESPQIVPSDIQPSVSNGDMPRERFTSERAPGSQRMPQVRDIPDSLDKVFIPRGGGGGGGGFARGRTSWRNPQFQPRYNHPYRRNNVHRGNFNQRASFPPPQIRSSPPQMRQEIRPDMRPDIRHDIGLDHPDMHLEMRPERPDMPPEMRPDMRPDMRHDMRHDMRPDMRAQMRQDIRPGMRPDFPPDMRRPDIRDPHMPPQMGPEMSPERPDVGFRPDRQFGPGPRFPQFRPGMDEPRPFRPNFEQRPMYGYRPNFGPRPFGPPIREIVPNNANQMPQVTIRQPPPPGAQPPKLDKFGPNREQEVIMLPVLPPGPLHGKKVLINPHFRGAIAPPVDGLPTYIPTRIQKTPPLSPTLENAFGPVKDIDDAAERFIAEQWNALARAANRKLARRSPQRYIENTTIEIENDLMGGAPPRRNSDDELLRRQEQFINANRAGLRRRMRSPTPPRRSVSPRRSPERSDRFDRERADRDRERRYRSDAGTGAAAQPRTHDEESEYRRRLREQESLRERVLRAKEVRRRKNAVALHKQIQERDRERLEKDKEPPKEPPKPVEQTIKQSEKLTVLVQDSQPDTTRVSPDNVEPKKVEKIEPEVTRERTPVKDDTAEVNSTCEALTPPREKLPSPLRGLTPPLPRRDSDDDLDLILGDIDGILSDEDDTGRFKEKTKPEPPSPADLRSKLPPRAAGSSSGGGSKRTQRQKIVFDGKDDKKKKDKSPPRKAVVTSSTKTANTEKKSKAKSKTEENPGKSRERITFSKKEAAKEKDDKKQQSSLTNRRVILQRKITQTPKEKSVFARIESKNDPTKPNPGIFSRAVRTAIGSEKPRIVIKKHEEPEVEYESDSDLDEDRILEEEIGNTAEVTNLPHGMTDTRLKTLAGSDVQSLSLDKEERSAKISFKTTVAAETFKRKFNNKMVAASRLTVTLR